MGRTAISRLLAALLVGGLLAAAIALLVRDDDDEPTRSDVAVAEILGEADTAGFARATEARPFVFPRDHGPHPNYRTEWWYLTGNLETPEGRRFGYQFTLFRSALAPAAPGAGPPSSSPDGSSRSAWRTNQAYMAHFALTDPAGNRFHTEERFARGALGLAGARVEPFRVWLEDWSVTAVGEDAAFPARLEVASEGVELELRLERGKPPVPQGDDGLSPKGPQPGNASHYFSLTRMPTRGHVVMGGDRIAVEGLSWMDREWGTSQLGPDLAGWDWFALQLDDGTDLMYYRLRREDGTGAPESAGRWVEPDGSHRRLERDSVDLRVREWWESPAGDSRYPVSWRLEVPSRELDVVLEPVLHDQEWRGTFRYWEGAVDVRGSRRSEPVEGRGYVEATGYAGEVRPGGR